MYHCEPWKSQALFIIALVFAFVCALAEALYLPSLPHIAQAFDLNGATFENCTWCLYCGLGLSILVHGFIADYIGRTTAVFCGQTLVMAGSLLSIFARDPQEFLFATIVLSLGLGSSVLLCRILARDLFQGIAFIQRLSLVSFSTLILTPIAPLLVHRMFPRGSWQTLFLALFIVVSLSFILMQVAFSDRRLRRVLQHSPAQWSLSSLYRPSVLISLSLALLNGAIIFLYQSAIVQIFPSGQTLYMLAIPALAAFISLLMFSFTPKWSYSIASYLRWRQGFSIAFALLGTLSWNIFQNEGLFIFCLAILFILQSNILSVVTVALMEDRVPIGLSASLVSAIHHVVIGIAMLCVPMTLRNSPKDLIVLIPCCLILATPLFKVANVLSLRNSWGEQELDTQASLSA